MQKHINYAAIILFFFMVNMALAQNKYDRATRDYSFQGIKIGMTEAQVNANHKDVRVFSTDRSGRNPLGDGVKSLEFELDDATQISLFTYKGKVFRMEISLTGVYINEHGGEIKFVNELSKIFGDPTESDIVGTIWLSSYASRKITYFWGAHSLWIKDPHSKGIKAMGE
jgi:uncharacterized protein YigE (DUF2233 family)